MRSLSRKESQGKFSRSPLQCSSLFILSKCCGFPQCQGCRDAGVHCRPYTRRKKADTILYAPRPQAPLLSSLIWIRALKEAEERIRWLESELSRDFGIDCSQLPTGASLRSVRGVASFDAVQSIDRPMASRTTPVFNDDDQTLPTAVPPQETENDAPSISLVTLNATGEQKYLGPSSGAFFASHAAAILRAYTKPKSHQASIRRTATRDRVMEGPAVDHSQQQPLPPKMAWDLHQSYVLWIHPLYLVFSLDKLHVLITECVELQNVPSADMLDSPERAGRMAMFYLVMALGATNYENTIKRLRRTTDPGSSGTFPEDGHSLANSWGPAPSAAFLYSKALPYFDILAKDLRPSLTTIQILLLVCIYSSYGPIDSSQWQLAGLAMRVSNTVDALALRPDNVITNTTGSWLLRSACTTHRKASRCLQN